MSSIPNAFDPMGLHEIEVPYIQPIMTGYNTWSNQPSFGLTVKANRDNYGKAWQALDGNSSTKWGTNTTNPAIITITFEKRLFIKSITLVDYYSNGGLDYLRIKADNQEIYYEENYPKTSVLKRLEVTPSWCTILVIDQKPTYANGSTGGIYDLKIEATF